MKAKRFVCGIWDAVKVLTKFGIYIALFIGPTVLAAVVEKGGKMMGQHKNNPNCALAKEGKLPLKPYQLSKREIERRMQRKVERAIGLDYFRSYLGRWYYG